MSRIRVVPPVVFILALGSQFLLHRAWPVTELVPSPWNLAGLVLLVPVIALGAGARALRRQGTTLHPFGQPTALVTSGPFGFSRNPLYLGLALLLVMSAILLGTLTPWLAVPAFVWTITALFIRREESALAAAFPEAFPAYCRRVRRWL